MLRCFSGMDINNFVDVQLPTKAQIFARTGQHSVSPAGSYTGDDPVKIGRSKTESAADFLNEVENFKEDLPEDES